MKKTFTTLSIVISLLCSLFALGLNIKRSQFFGGGFYSQQDNNLQTVSSTPVGGDGAVQFSQSGLFDGSNNLHWDNTNSRLGINTTTPGVSLVVDGDIYLASSTLGEIRLLPNNSCLLFTVTNTGSFVTSSISCP